MHRRSTAQARAAMATLAVLLAGCSTTPPDGLSPAEIIALHQSVSSVLSPMNRAANKEWLSGSVTLDISLDRSNQLLSCSATSISGAPGLVAVAERACWATVLPPFPAKMFDADGKLVIRMPLVFDMSAGEDPARRARFEAIIFPAFSQSQYFWDNGISRVPMSSVGLAHFRYVADREGRVLTCDVLIAPIHSRKAEFRPSLPLRAQLRTACPNMNLAHMPGFAASSNGLATGSVWTTYSPWRKGAQ